MKKVKTLAILMVIFVNSNNYYSQVKIDSLFKAITTALNPKAPPLSWELNLGGSFLTNTKLSQNLPLSDFSTISGSFYTYYDLLLNKKRANNLCLRPGVGINFQTFGLDKIIVNSNDKSEFVNFSSGQDYNYSYLQQIFIDVPVSIVYQTKPNHKNRYYNIEAGGVIGYMVSNENEFAVSTANSSTITNTESVKNLNSTRYGSFFKVSSRKYRLGKYIGYSNSVSVNYYFNDVFKGNNNTPTKSFSVMFGVGIFLNQKLFNE